MVENTPSVQVVRAFVVSITRLYLGYSTESDDSEIPDAWARIVTIRYGLDPGFSPTTVR